MMAYFGLKYYAEMRSKYKGVSWRVEIAERGFIGVAEEMNFAGSNPLKVTWENRGDDFFVPVKASEASITVLCHKNFQYINLFTSDPRKYRVTIFRNGGLYWRGFITADLYSESFSAPPYEVTIRAVDGFNILSSIDFYDESNTSKSGLRSLYSLLTPCIDVLELDMSLCDWLDLYAEGMSETTSPLKQTYLDMAMLYTVYETPTFRDVLELCLRPFAAQIFQSAGVLNIRRLYSLYSENRPAAFFAPNDNIPSAVRTTHQNVRIITEEKCRLANLFRKRGVQDNAWDGAMYIMGDNSTLEITPPIRSVNVAVKNKEIDDLTDRLGFFDSDNWSDANGALSFGDNKSLTIGGDNDYKGTIMQTSGYDVKQCNFTITWEFTLRALYSERRSSTGGYYTPRNTEPHTCTLNYGIKVVGSDATYYLTSDGAWDTSEVDVCSSVDTGTDENIKIEIDGIPINGKLVFYIRQTLGGDWYTYSGGRQNGQTVGSQEGMMFFNMRMSIDADEFYDNGLSINTIVNPANNIDMSISLPVSDIPAIPNDTMIFTLYFLHADKSPTRLWHTKGKDDYMNLVEHMTLCALKFRQTPSHKLSAEILSALHLDLNSILLDKKYLNAGFSINSIEVDALDDTHECELVELPKLLHSEAPLEGDDCIAMKLFTENCDQCIRCLNFLIMKMASGKLYCFDVLTKSMTLLYEDDETYDIFPAENGYVRAHQTEAFYCDYRGKVRKKLSIPTAYAGFITVRDGEWWVLCQYTGRYDSKYMVFSRPEIKTTYTRVAGTARASNILVYMYGTFKSAIVEKNQIVINTTSACYVYDNRYHTAPNVFKVSDYDQIVAINDDYFILAGSDDTLKCCHRDTLTTYTESESFGEYAYHAALSQTKFVTVLDSAALHDIKTLDSYYINNHVGQYTEIIDVFFIYGDLYLVQTNGIFKFIQKVNETS